MKKLVFSVLLAFCAVTFANAQSNALGARFGGLLGGGAEASFQLGISNVNRMEFGLGLHSRGGWNAMSASAVYQWVFDLSSLEPGFNWYTGVGGGLHWYSAYKVRNVTVYDGGATIAVLGVLGIEYNFDFPLQLSLDFRPGIYFGDERFHRGFGGGIGLGVRFRF